MVVVVAEIVVAGGGKVNEGDEAEFTVTLTRETEADVVKDLETALSFQPPHISIYHLTIEPNTYFAKFPPRQKPGSFNLDRVLEKLQEAGSENR